MTEHSNELAEMTAKLENFKPAKQNESAPLSKFSPGELVLAKYRLEEGSDELNWCRAVILKQKLVLNKYDIFYFDYGNYVSDVHTSELSLLPDDFGLDLYRPFAYQITLENANFDIENLAQAEVLAQFLIENENFMVKVMRSEPSLKNEKILNYFVQVWNIDLNSCLNQMLSPSDNTMTPIDKSSISRLLSASNRPLSIQSAYTFIDSFQNPFYFSTREDREKRNELDARLNEVFKRRTASIDELEIANARQGDYVAALSEENWYRTRIVAIENNQWTLLYVDYGYEEVLDPREESQRLRMLDDEFLSLERLAFGCCLIEDMRNKEVKAIEVTNKEVSFIIIIMKSGYSFRI